MNLQYSPIIEFASPEYKANRALYCHYRAVLEGGLRFIDRYLKRFSTRESFLKFEERKSLAYCPAYAKSLLYDIVHSISNRLTDVKRSNICPLYSSVVSGKNGGVNQKGDGINKFLSEEILPELLALSTVGIFVDRDSFDGKTKMDGVDKPPYINVFKAEEILNLRMENNEYTSVLLAHTIEKKHAKENLIVGNETQFILFEKFSDGVYYKIFNEKQKEFGSAIKTDLKIIPFYIFKLPNSLFEDVHRHQAALLNISSSDLNYVLVGNFPIYTENVNPFSTDRFTKNIADPDINDVVEGDSGDGTYKKSEVRDASVGIGDGRAYAKGLDRPDFISPSSEPLIASMKKQEQIVNEIYEIMHFNIKALAKNASEDSKKYSDKYLEAGMFSIGEVIKKGEEVIEQFFCMYEGVQSKATFLYPEHFDLRTREERISNAEKMINISPKIQSPTFRKEVLKEAASLIINNSTDPVVIKKINSEIDSIEAFVVEHDNLMDDLEKGLVGNEYASELLGYPKGQVKQAEIDHANRAARILLAQTSASQQGVTDLTNKTNTDNVEEKENQQTSTLQTDATQRVRS